MISEMDDIVLARAKPTPVKIVGWIGALVFLAFAIVSWRQRADLWVSIVFIAFVCLGLYLVMASGPLEITSRFILHKTPLARYRIGWDEVGRIEIDPAGTSIAFIGEGKQLVAAGLGYWAAADLAGMLRVIQLEVERRKIQVDFTRKAMWRLPKKTKVRE
jgi:hypothetical protein